MAQLSRLLQDPIEQHREYGSVAEIDVDALTDIAAKFNFVEHHHEVCCTNIRNRALQTSIAPIVQPSSATFTFEKLAVDIVSGANFLYQSMCVT
jgi:hypothetical protein